MRPIVFAAADLGGGRKSDVCRCLSGNVWKIEKQLDCPSLLAKWVTGGLAKGSIPDPAVDEICFLVKWDGLF